MTTIVVAVPDLVSPSYFPMVAAAEVGSWQRGLDVRVELIFSVADVYRALAGGEVAYVGARWRTTLGPCLPSPF